MRETWWCAHSRCLERGGVLDVRALAGVAAAMQAEGTRLSSDRQSAVLLLPGPPPLLLKWRRPVGTRRRFKAWGRPSRERKEARAALLARARGIATPAPLAVGERRLFAGLVGAVLLRPYFPRMVPGEIVLRSDPGRVEAFAEALRDWHDRGFRHGDCYPKNCLATPDGKEIWPIGFPAARFVRPGPTLDRARRRDLAQWAAGMAALFGEPEAFAFLPAYLRAAPGLPAPGHVEAAVRPRYDRVMAKKTLRTASRPQREPEGPPPPRALGADVGPPVPQRVLPLTALAHATKEVFRP